MPKKPPRDNPPVRAGRTVQTAAAVLQRINQRTGILPAAGESPAQQLEQLRRQLPAEIARHVVDAIQKADELVCFVDSAVWAGRVKLAAAELPGFTGGRRLTLRVLAKAD